jgi:hypothetical protein
MPNVNFGSFISTQPRGTDFVVGYRGTSETRITISALTALNLPIVNTLNGLNSIFASNSGNYGSVYVTTHLLSSNWNSVYTTVQQNSATNNSLFASTYTTLNSNSALWDLAYTIALNVSNTPTDLLALSSLTVLTIQPSVNNLSLSSNFWNSNYTTTKTNSAQWSSVYSVVSQNSAYWDVAVNKSNSALQRTGDALTAGNLTTWKSLSTDFTESNEFVSKLYVDALAIATTISGNFVPDLYYTKNEVYNKTQTENLLNPVEVSVNLIGSISGTWNNTATVVSNNSAAWNYQATDIKSLTGNWQSTFNTVNSLSSLWSTGITTLIAQNSAGWESVETTVNSNSAGWESVESTVYKTSGFWNNAYTDLITVSSELINTKQKALYLESNIIEVTDDIVINNTTQSIYVNKILHVSSDEKEITITFDSLPSTNFNCSLVNLGTQDVVLLPADGSLIKSPNYRIYGNQFATVSLYKYKNYIYALGTIPVTS